MVGADNVNGKPVNTYQIIEKKTFEGNPVNLTFWIGKADNVLYQVREDLGAVTVTVTYSDLKSDIELPS